MEDRKVDANGRELSRRTVVKGAGGGAAAAALVALGLAASARPAAAQDEQEVLDAWAAAWSSGSGEEVAAVYTEDGIYEDVPAEDVVQGEDIVSWTQEFFDTVEDVSQTIESWVASTDGAVVQWTYEYTHSATGNQVSYRGISILELADGLIAHEIAYYDQATVWVQQGGTCEGPSEE